MYSEIHLCIQKIIYVLRKSFMYQKIHLCNQKIFYELSKSLMCSKIHLFIQKFLVMDHNEDEERLMESLNTGGPNTKVPTFTEEERSQADAFLNITGEIDTRTADIDSRVEDNNEDLIIVNAEGSKEVYIPCINKSMNALTARYISF